MTDTITESFCERCGTRYALDPAAKPRRGGFGRVRVLTRGLKNYVANDGLPMSEAMAAARVDEDRAGITRQLDAFHDAFNFCMTCRQYTCGNCWNEKAGECLTCSPDLSREILPPAFPDLPAAGPVGAGNGHAAGGAEVSAWPRVDLDRGTSTAAPATGATNLGDVEAGAGTGAEAPPEPGTAGAADVMGEEPAIELDLEEPSVLARLDAFVAAPAGAGIEDLTPDELAEIKGALAVAQVGAVAAEAEAAVEPVPDALAAATAEPGTPAPTGLVAEPAIVEPAAVADVAAVTELGVVADVAAVAEPAVAEPAVVEPAVADAAAAAADRTTASEPTPDQAELGRGRTRTLLNRFRPARSTGSWADPAPARAAAARAVTGPEAASGAAAPGPDPVPAPDIIPTPEAAPIGPAPVAPAAAPLPQSVAAAAEPGAPATEPQAAPAEQEPTPADAIEQPTWRIAPPIAPAPTPGPVEPWPASPSWPSTPPDSMPVVSPGAAAAPWAARLATARPEPVSVWAASTQEVLGPAGPDQAPGAPAIQACVSCGLSLSANARFCRRCGSRQS